MDDAVLLVRPENLCFYLFVPQRGLEILNIVVLSCVLCERVKGDWSSEKELRDETT